MTNKMPQFPRIIGPRHPAVKRLEKRIRTRFYTRKFLKKFIPISIGLTILLGFMLSGLTFDTYIVEEETVQSEETIYYRIGGYLDVVICYTEKDKGWFEGDMVTVWKVDLVGDSHYEEYKDRGDVKIKLLRQKPGELFFTTIWSVVQTEPSEGIFTVVEYLTYGETLDRYKPDTSYKWAVIWVISTVAEGNIVTFVTVVNEAQTDIVFSGGASRFNDNYNSLPPIWDILKWWRGNQLHYVGLWGANFPTNIFAFPFEFMFDVSCIVPVVFDTDWLLTHLEVIPLLTMRITFNAMIMIASFLGLPILFIFFWPVFQFLFTIPKIIIYILRLNIFLITNKGPVGWLMAIGIVSVLAFILI